MTNAVSSSKVDLNEHEVLRAISAAKCEIDHRVKSGVFGVNLEGAISKLARIMNQKVTSIKQLIDKLMSQGLIKYAKSRLFACHKTGRSPAHRRSVVMKGAATRRQLVMEAVRRDRMDPDWDPNVPTLEEVAYGEWAATIHSKSIPPAGGWEGCCALVARNVTQGVKLRGLIAEGIYLVGAPCEGDGSASDVAHVMDSRVECSMMMDTADLVGVLVDGEREQESRRRPQLVS